MTSNSSYIDNIQDVVAQVPDGLQPLVVAAAGAVPFIEGEGAASIGILGGLNPIVAGLAAATGNFLCVALLVLLGSGVRTAIVTRSADSPASVTHGYASGSSAAVAPPKEQPRSARREKVQRGLERYGVPGVSLLGPLLLPTMFTATALVASGVPKSRVLAWQALAIAVWTAGVTVLATGALSVLN